MNQRAAEEEAESSGTMALGAQKADTVPLTPATATAENNAASKDGRKANGKIQPDGGRTSSPKEEPSRRERADSHQNIEVSSSASNPSLTRAARADGSSALTMPPAATKQVRLASPHRGQSMEPGVAFPRN